MRRRSMLRLHLLSVGAAAVLAGCGEGHEAPDPQASAPALAPDAATVTDGPSASAPAQAAVTLTGTANNGTPMTVDVGPIIRSAQYTVVRLSFATQEDGSQSAHLSGTGDLRGVCLLDLESALVWPELDTSREALKGTTNYSVRAGEPLVAHAVYAAVPQTLSQAQVLVPAFGIAVAVPVVDEDDLAAQDTDVQAILAGATLEEERTGPFPVEFFTGAADGTVEAAYSEQAVEMTLASDVTFAVDSADLSAQADAQLANVVQQLARCPSGGSLAVTGHTDDVADDAYNQALSERRAQAVVERLGQMTDLSSWRLTVTGKGENEPREAGTSSEARAANRRVELQAVPARPEELRSASLAEVALSDLPPTEGPEGLGPQGVEVEVESVGRVHLKAAEVRKIGRFLVGHVTVECLDAEGTVLANRLTLPRPFSRRWQDRAAVDTASADRLTLLVGGTRLLAADYQPGSEARRPLTTLNLPAVKAGVPATVPVVWPDTGQDAVVIDLPGDATGHSVAGPVLRLTDVPVVS